MNMSLPLGLLEHDLSESDNDISDDTSHHNTKRPLQPQCSSRLSPPTTRPIGEAGGVVEAVIVNTHSMMMRANVPQYEKVLLLPTDSIFARRPSSISEFFNIALIARTVTKQDRPKLARFLRETQVPNLPVRALFRECDVTGCDEAASIDGSDYEFGEHKLLIDGSVVLARQDQKPLHPSHAQMVLEYIEEQTDPLFNEYHKEQKRWMKRLDGIEYRQKMNELRGHVLAAFRERKLRKQWELFGRENKEFCAGVDSPWEL